MTIFGIFFQFFDIYSHYSGFLTPRKPPLGFDNKPVEFFVGHGLIFNFLISRVLAIF